MEMELEIEEEPGVEEEEEEKPKVEGAVPTGGGIELRISLENPEIHVDKLIIKKKE